MSVISYTLTLSLFDSLSTSQQIIIFALLLTTLKPLRNSLSYLAGLSGSYLVCGVCGYLAIGRLRAFIGTYFNSTASMSDAVYYEVELVLGIVMVFIGAVYFFRKRRPAADRYQNIIVTRLKSMSSLFAFTLGAVISVTSFPLSIPYIIALGKYASLSESLPAAVGHILLYNIGYALPMIAILLIYLYARGRTDDINDALHEKTRLLNVHLTTWAWAGVGLFSMTDAGCFFALGHSLVKGRLLM